MRNQFIVAIISFIIFFPLSYLKAQEKVAGKITRCATMLRIDDYRKKNDYLLKTVPNSIFTPTTPRSTQRITSIITIPIVVHIVLSNPYIVTDADVQVQIDRLNQDFAGFNSDSTNIPAQFNALRGHSKIRFCLAKRTPTGQLTSGIERRASATGSDALASKDPIKFTDQGGLDAWDPSQYLNYWVGTDGTGGGILGYAQFPNSTIDNPASDGIFINVQAWGSNPCYTLPPFNKGRTTIHETGHYFGLFHIWGDDGNSCSGDDFADLTTASSSCSLPSNLQNAAGQANTSTDVGDTPNQAGETNGCPGPGAKTDVCSNTAPGVMYQNHMDYSDDACLTMFTNKQVERMEWILSNCRVGLTTSLGCQPPANAVSLDAAPAESVSPGGFESSGCGSLLYPSVLLCPGNVTPKFRITNKGLTTLTSVTVGFRINGGPAITQNLSVSIPLGGTQVVSFSPVGVTTGNNVFKFFTSSPNGSTDQVPSNDTISQNLLVLGTTTAPVVENFESTIFPPPNWAIDNYNDDETWQRKPIGNNSSGSLFINNYEIDATNTRDDFKSSRINISGYDSVVVSFDLAHKNYPQTDFHDTLTVLVTKDCGVSFQTIYKKWGNGLATSGSSASSFDAPVAEDWRRERMVLSGSILSSGEISIIFRNTSRYGNNIFIDNINIEGKNAAPSFRDIKVSAITSPTFIVCSTAVVPQVEVSNVGVDIITSFKVGFKIGTGAPIIQTFNQILIPGASTIVTFTAATALLGENNFTAFTADPVSLTGTGDDNKLNDTLIKHFELPGNVQAPLVEGFENSIFPPANWAVSNPDNNISWKRFNGGNNSTGSAYVSTYNYPVPGQVDDLYTPSISYNNADSVFLTFDVAATYRSAGVTDTLTVFITKDCGNTFTTVYKKWGDDLKTTASPLATEFVPTSSQWRKELVDLSAFAKQSPINIVFRIGSSNGNNIFLDNVNLSTKSSPPTLRRRGFLILPTAFRNEFIVLYSEPPADIQFINVYSSSGQLVYTKQITGNTERSIKVDLSGKPAGSYLVHLGYEDASKNVSQWVIKQ